MSKVNRSTEEVDKLESLSFPMSLGAGQEAGIISSVVRELLESQAIGRPSEKLSVYTSREDSLLTWNSWSLKSREAMNGVVWQVEAKAKKTGRKIQQII